MNSDEWLAGVMGISRRRAAMHRGIEIAEELAELLTEQPDLLDEPEFQAAFLALGLVAGAILNPERN